jgi:hypothetical protein
MGGMSDEHQGESPPLPTKGKYDRARHHARRRQLNFELGEQEERRGTWAVDRGWHERTPRVSSQGAQGKRRRRASSPPEAGRVIEAACMHA